MPSEKGKQAADLLSLLESLALLSSDNKANERLPASHAFWSTQPVPQSQADLRDAVKDGPIDASCSVEAVRREPLVLPDGYEFVLMDLTVDSETDELYRLLRDNYVEDYDSLFRFEYSTAFLEWALKPPGWRKDWHVGVRGLETGELVAFIAATPCVLSIREQTLQSAEVNFLCIAKHLRMQRLAPLMIQEVTRRVNLTGIFQALYTAGIKLPEPIATARYFHRPLDIEKLIDTGFSYHPPDRTMDQMKAQFRLPAESSVKIRPVEEGDLATISRMLHEYVQPFGLRHELNDEAQCRHWLLPRDQVLHSYVMLDAHGNGSPDGFFSFYSIPSAVLGNATHDSINVAYLFYYAVRDENRLVPMMKAALIEAKRLGFDVMNCLDIMHNVEFTATLKFGEGDGQLRYYLYNWKTKPLLPKEVAFVML